MDEIMTELQNINDPKTLFKYCSTIEGYFKDKRFSSFRDFLSAKNLDLPILDRIADKIDNIKRENQRDGRIPLKMLQNEITKFIISKETLKTLANNNTENGLSQILNYDNLYLCAEYIAINLVLIDASKSNVYDLLNIFKNPNIETAIKEDISLIKKDISLIKPLFAIGLASVQGLNEDTLNLFFGIANKVKSIDDLKLLKLFIEAISVYFDSYSKGGNK